MWIGWVVARLGASRSRFVPASAGARAGGCGRESRPGRSGQHVALLLIATTGVRARTLVRANGQARATTTTAWQGGRRVAGGRLAAAAAGGAPCAGGTRCARELAARRRWAGGERAAGAPAAMHAGRMPSENACPQHSSQHAWRYTDRHTFLPRRPPPTRQLRSASGSVTDCVPPWPHDGSSLRNRFHALGANRALAKGADAYDIAPGRVLHARPPSRTPKSRGAAC